MTCVFFLSNFKVGLDISRMNADSQRNPVYNAFRRIFCCGNETIRRYFCKRDLDAANLRPALEQGCRKQTPSARKFFSRANLLYVRYIKNVEETEIWVCAFFGYLRKKNRCAMPNSDFFCGRNTFFFGSRHCAAVLSSQVNKKCTDLDLSLLYILILGTYSKITFFFGFWFVMPPHS